MLFPLGEIVAQTSPYVSFIREKFQKIKPRIEYRPITVLEESDITHSSLHLAEL